MPGPATGRQVGVDMGVARFLTTSDGEIIANPKFLAASTELIADLQRRKDRARSGSGNRKRIRRQLAREWRKVRNRRRDFHHKTARAIVNACDAIALERLQTASMTRRPKPRPGAEQPGRYLTNRAAAKAGLNKAVLDAGWAQLIGILTGKAEEAGRHVIRVNPAGTSIGCHQCGRRCTRPRQDTVICPVHGQMDADVNGARNVYTRAGLGSGQAVWAAWEAVGVSRQSSHGPYPPAPPPTAASVSRRAASRDCCGSGRLRLDTPPPVSFMRSRNGRSGV